MRPLVRASSWLLAIALAFFATQPAATAPEQDCAGGHPPAVEFGRRILLGTRVTGTIEVRANDAGTRYLRLRLSVSGGDGGWSAVVRDKTGRAVNVFDPRSFESGVRWTDRIDGDVARVDVFVAPGRSVPTLMVDESLEMSFSQNSQYYSYEDENNKRIEPLYAVSSLDYQRLGDTVGLVFAMRRGMVWACSAVAVTADIVMTNWHCGGPPDANAVDVWTQPVCNATILDFSWDDDRRSREFVCREVLKASNPELDVAFLRVQAIERADVLRPATLLDRAPRSEEVLMVHHPEALPKQLTRNCRFSAGVDVGGDRFAHTCDSEGGSSGAPVFDVQGRVLGLHHEGFQRDPQTCGAIDRVNKAVRIDKILAWLREPSTPGGAALLGAMAVARQ